MRYAWDIVVRLRPTIFVAVLAFLIFSKPAQMLELYLIDIENVLTRQLELGREGQSSLWAFLIAGRPIWTAMICGVVTVALLGLGSVHLLALERHRESEPPGRLRYILAGTLMVLVASAPVLGILVGLDNAREEIPRIEQSETAAELHTTVANYRWFTLGFLAATVALFAAGWLLLRRRLEKFADLVFSPAGFLFGAAAIILFALAIVRSPTTLPWALGTQALVFIFLAALAFVLTCFSRAYRLTGIPVTVLVLGAAFLFSNMGWNDNHKVEHKVCERGPDERQGFYEWLTQRRDLAFYEKKGKPYPVYMVAAEGGGIYAGYHVSSFLARMQATCPRFGQHVFAISSVSGGSLGAAVFAAHANRGIGDAKNEPEPAYECENEIMQEGEIVEGVSEFFRRDFLAPLVAATLFPDMLQRLIPYPIPAFDRARGLERAFIDARSTFWTSDGKSNPFEDSINALWDPSGATPALFLNTTSVEMGARVTIGPLTSASTPTALHISSLLCRGAERIDVALASAVSLSARFPILTPAGWFQRDEASEKQCGEPPRLKAKREGAPSGAKRDRLYLVDGGYFENSGLETMLEMAARFRAMNRTCISGSTLRECAGWPKHGVDFRIIMVFAKDDYADQFWSNGADLSATSPGELVPPLRTMLKTRQSRTRAVHARESLFDEDYNYLPTAGRYTINGVRYLGHDDIHHVMLDGVSSFLPLGWRLSQRSMRNIAESRTPPTAMTFELIRRELMGEETESVKRPRNR